MDTGFAERRLLVGNGKLNYLVFKFTQSRTDGSIYISSPRFSEIKWIWLTQQDGELNVIVKDCPYDGHISMHGTGMASVRNNSDPKERHLIISGNYLLDLPRNQAGVRHLFTALIAEPSKVPLSIRRSDYLISSSKPLNPVAVIFFAIPRVAGIQHVSVQTEFHLDDLESTPPDSGFGLVELVHHSIAWFAYKTKYMSTWPKAPHVCFFDGFHIPVFMGSKDGTYQFALVSPKYEAEADELRISISFANLQRS